MTERKSPLRRLLAGVGAFALAAAGLLGTGVAHAEVTTTVDPDKTGSITLHKHVTDEASTPGNPAGAPLEGVEFTLQPVVSDPALDLTTTEGWAAAEALFTDFAASGELPDGYTLGAPQSFPATAANGSTTMGGLPVGIYLVTETGTGENLIETPAVPFLVSIPLPVESGFEYDVVAYPKNTLGEFTVEKEIATPEGGFKTIEVGDALSWNITVNVPAAALPYVSLTISDNLPADQTFVSWSDLAIGGTALDAADYTVDADNVVTFTQAGLDKLNAVAAGEDGVATTVTAVLNATVASIPANGVFSNEATATINGQPEDGSGKTNYGAILINKSSNVDDASLAGAQFELYDAAPNAAGEPQGTLVASGTTDANGEILWTVWVGDEDVTSKDFWLLETAPLPNHVLPANPWYGFGDMVDAITVNAGTEVPVALNVVNYQPGGPTLPETGSTGSLVFGIIGLGLIAAAGATVAVRKVRAAR